MANPGRSAWLLRANGRVHVQLSNAKPPAPPALNSNKYDLTQLSLELSAASITPMRDTLYAPQDPVLQARTPQEQTTKLLAELLQAPNTAATARKHVDLINEEFFMVSSTYLDMVSSNATAQYIQLLLKQQQAAVCSCLTAL